MSGRGEGGAEQRDRRRIGLVIASIPVALFVLSAAFIALRPPDPPAACRHEHPADQVRAWWEKAVRNEVSVPGTRYVALDEPGDGGGGATCIRVGLEERTAQTHLERRFHRLGVPREVVVYEPASAGASGTPGGRTPPPAPAQGSGEGRP